MQLSKSTVESLKELARVVVLAVLPVLVTSLESGQYDLKSTVVVLAVAVLRALDKYTYEQNKINLRQSAVKLPF